MPTPSASNELEELTYIALSYHWPRQVVPITDEDNMARFAALPIPVLLQSAIMNEISGPQEGLWCDQICINQDDEEEKAISIGLMDVIYQQARFVAIAFADVEISCAEQTFMEEWIPQYMEQLEARPREQAFVPFHGDRVAIMNKYPILKGIFRKL